MSMKSSPVQERYGNWTVLDPTVTYRAHDKVACVCVCGTRRDVVKHALVQGRSTSCGCVAAAPRRGKSWPAVAHHRDAEAIPGARFGRWTVLTHPVAGHNRTVVCQCDCGTRKDNVVVADLLRGHSSSCGCLRREGLVALNRASTM